MDTQEPRALIHYFDTIENLNEMTDLINYIINMSHTSDIHMIHTQQLFQSLDIVQPDIEVIKEHLKHLP